MSEALLEVISLLVGLAALGISVFSVWISLWAFRQSSHLFQDMLQLVTRVEDLSAGTHTSIQDLIKGAWDSFLDKEQEDNHTEDKALAELKQQLAANLKKLGKEGISEEEYAALEEILINSLEDFLNKRKQKSHFQARLIPTIKHSSTAN